ncbi:hypothetical protein ACMFMG_010750 [Clarireedia jacksonii]
MISLPSFPFNNSSPTVRILFRCHLYNTYKHLHRFRDCASTPVAHLLYGKALKAIITSVRSWDMAIRAMYVSPSPAMFSSVFQYGLISGTSWRKRSMLPSFIWYVDGWETFYSILGGALLAGIIKTVAVGPYGSFFWPRKD